MNRLGNEGTEKAEKDENELKAKNGEHGEEGERDEKQRGDKRYIVKRSINTICDAFQLVRLFYLHVLVTYKNYTPQPQLLSMHSGTRHFWWLTVN